jgi:hypothetical protein
MAQTGGFRAGRACPLSPGISDINLFRYCQGVIDLDADHPPIDQGRSCASKRMSPKQPRVQSDPFRYEARLLAGGQANIGTATARKQGLTGPFVGL